MSGKKTYTKKEEARISRVKKWRASMIKRGGFLGRRKFTKEQKLIAGAKFKKYWDNNPEARIAQGKKLAAICRGRKGCKQSPEHIAKRTAALKATRARRVAEGKVYPRPIPPKWSEATRKKRAATIKIRNAEIRERNTITCRLCGGHKLRTKTQVEKYVFHFCSHKCYLGYLKKFATTDECVLARSSKEYYNWKRRVRRRDKNTCQDCGITGKQKELHAHHLLSFSIFKQFRYDTWNGRMLCESCHPKAHRKFEFRRMAELRKEMQE